MAESSAMGADFFACAGAGEEANHMLLALATGLVFCLVVRARFYPSPRLRPGHWFVLFVVCWLLAGDIVLLGALAVLLACGVFFYGKFNMPEALRAMARHSEGAPESLPLKELLKHNLAELREFARQGELRIAALSEKLRSFESKCYFVITGAAVITAFFLAEDWCFDGFEFLRGASVVFCLIAGILSGWMLTGDKVGLAGAEPRELLEEGNDVKEALKNRADPEDPDGRDGAMRLHLIMTLIRQNKAIQKSDANLSKKQVVYSLMLFFLFTGIISAVLWVLIRMLQH